MWTAVTEGRAARDRTTKGVAWTAMAFVIQKGS
jgi:hypothetical protein